MTHEETLTQYKLNLTTLRNKLGGDGVLAMIKIIDLHKAAGFREFIIPADLQAAQAEALDKSPK